MNTVRGTLVGVALFGGSFALHIVAGATDQGWLFAIAVALIYVTAAGFAGIAVLAAGPSWRGGDIVLAGWGVLGVTFTWGALWAANGQAFAWWEGPAALALEVLGSGAILLLARRVPFVAAFRRASPDGEE